MIQIKYKKKVFHNEGDGVLTVIVQRCGNTGTQMCAPPLETFRVRLTFQQPDVVKDVPDHCWMTFTRSLPPQTILHSFILERVLWGIMKVMNWLEYLSQGREGGRLVSVHPGGKAQEALLQAYTYLGLALRRKTQTSQWCPETGQEASDSNWGV